MSYSTPIPPLVPFSPSGRRPLSQPISSEENKTDIPAKMSNYESQTERGRSGGKHSSILPPLISALDTYIESSVEAKADSIIVQTQITTTLVWRKRRRKGSNLWEKKLKFPLCKQQLNSQRHWHRQLRMEIRQYIRQPTQ